MVFDDPLAAPSGRTPGKIGLAVLIGIEDLGDLRILELLDICDSVRLGGSGID